MQVTHEMSHMQSHRNITRETEQQELSRSDQKVLEEIGKNNLKESEDRKELKGI